MNHFSWVRRRALLLAPALMCASLAACGDDSWFGASAPKPLPGTRISVLTEAPALTTEAKEKITLPRPQRVADWPQAGGFAPHAMFHLSLAEAPKKAWSADLGEGAAKRRAFLTQPIVANGTVFAMDAESTVSAYRLADGRRLWKLELAVKDVGDGSYGGGLAYDRGSLFVTTGYSQLVRLDPGSGKIVWRHNLPAPVRGAPTVRAGRVLVITVENETIADAAFDGHELWHHNGIEEQAMLMGGASPAVDGNTVIVTYSSGEIYALRIENGTQLWVDTLTSATRTNQVSTLPDIRGLPVIDRGRVFAAGNSDMVAGLDLATGRRLWDREVGSTQTPWVAGNYVFLITDTPELVCFRADTGQVVWVRRLAQWEDPEAKTGLIDWTGPLLASDRLIVSGSNGRVISVSPYTGIELGRIELGTGITIPPIVADATLIFVTDEGELVAYR